MPCILPRRRPAASTLQRPAWLPHLPLASAIFKSDMKFFNSDFSIIIWHQDFGIKTPNRFLHSVSRISAQSLSPIKPDRSHTGIDLRHLATNSSIRIPSRTSSNRSRTPPQIPPTITTTTTMASWSDASYNWHSGSDALTNDPRKCHVVGCYKKHAYVRNAKGHKIYSQYCTHRALPSPFHCRVRLANESARHLRQVQPGTAWLLHHPEDGRRQVLPSP